MHSFINQALIDRAIGVLTEYRNVELSSADMRAKASARTKAVKALQGAIDYLKGDYGILSMEDIKRAKELDEKEPQFIEVAEHNQNLTKELRLVKERLARANGEEGELPKKFDPPKKAKAKKKRGRPPKANKAAPKKAKKPGGKILVKNLSCPKCGRKFKNAAGLGRHKKACKG